VGSGTALPGRPGIDMVGYGVVRSGKAGCGSVWPGEAEPQHHTFLYLNVTSLHKENQWSM